MSTDDKIADSEASRNGRRCPFPSYNWYPQDYLASPKVARFTAAQHGIYRTLLDHAWMNDGLTEADVEIVAEALASTVEECSTVLNRCFRLCGDRWRSDRQERERALVMSARQKKVDAGKKSAAARDAAKAETATLVNSAEQCSTGVGSHPLPLPSPLPSPEKKKTPLPPVGEVTPKPSKSKPEYPPEPTDPRALQAYRDVKEHRKSKFTPIVARKTIRLLEQIGVDRFVAAVDHSIANGWAAIVEPRGATNGKIHTGWEHEPLWRERLRTGDASMKQLAVKTLAEHGVTV